MESLTKSQQVYNVFENISKGYDDANKRISLGLQDSWKMDLVNRIVRDTPLDGNLLDVCCGTGDIAIWTGEMRSDLDIIGVDFSKSMLDEAQVKSVHMDNIDWDIADAMFLPFEDNRFSSVCISFGLRNTSDYKQVLREMKRVLKPGGYLYCLDSFVPDARVIKPFYSLYFKHIMPFLGGGRKYRQEYLWLYESTQQFLRKKELIELYKDIGLRKIRYFDKMFGACVLVYGQKEK